MYKCVMHCTFAADHCLAKHRIIAFKFYLQLCALKTTVIDRIPAYKLRPVDCHNDSKVLHHSRQCIIFGSKFMPKSQRREHCQNIDSQQHLDQSNKSKHRRHSNNRRSIQPKLKSWCCILPSSNHKQRSSCHRVNNLQLRTLHDLRNWLYA